MYLSNPNLRKSIRQKYRKIALCISLVFHVVIMAVFVLFFLNPEDTEVDKIHAEILPELSRQIVNEQETPNPILAKRNDVFTVPQKRDVTIAKPNQSKEIAKLPTPATPSADQGQLSASANFDPHFDQPNLSTDVLLKPNPESMMSPKLPSGVIGGTGSKTRNFKGVRNQKDTGKGVSKTGPGKKNGSSKGESQGNKDGSGTGHGSGGTGYGDGNASLKTIEKLTNDILTNSDGNPIDVVLVLDRSGSMNDIYRSLAEHLSDVSDAYKASKIDLMFGLTCFYTKKHSRKIEHTIQLYPLTRNISLYKQEFYSIRIAGNENVLDAIHNTVTGKQFRTYSMNTGKQFRTYSMKHLILVTDEEEFTSINRHTLDSVIKLCQKNKISVHVIGSNSHDHKRIAKETGGSWYKIRIYGIK